MQPDSESQVSLALLSTEKPTEEEPKKTKKRKRKRKRKKKKQAQAQKKQALERVQAYWKVTPNQCLYTYSEYHTRLPDLLRIEPKTLNYAKEMQRLFNDQLFSVRQSLPQGWTKKQINIHRQQMKKFRPKKKYFLVHNEDVKIKLSHRLSMRQTRNDPGHKCKFFAFDAAGKLAALAETYREVKNTHDIGSTMDFLHSHPYFPEALYDLGEYQRLQGNFKEANLLLEKMLFFYEDCFDFSFRIFESNIEAIPGSTAGAQPLPETLASSTPELLAHKRHYLDWNVNTWTDLFFRLVFKFVVILVKKSCFRSALGFTKLLLKLDPLRDPMGALIMLDHAALGASEYLYLEEFTLTFGHRYFLEPNCSLLLYPNYLFSLALARFRMTSDKQSKGECDQPNRPWICRLLFRSQSPRKAWQCSKLLTSTRGKSLATFFSCWASRCTRIFSRLF